MNNRQLESFLAIVQLGSFAAAAERLHVTQSTVSARIQELEDDLGISLFDRSQRQVHLTNKGRQLVAYAEQVTHIFREIKEQLGSDTAIGGIVRIGVAELVALTWLPSFTRAVSKKFPNVILEFEVGLNPALLAGVKKGDFDIAIIAGPSTDTTFVARPLGTVLFSWMCSPDLYPTNELMTARDLRRWPIVYQGTDSYTTEATNTWLGIRASKKHLGTSCNSLAAVKSLTVAGVGVSLLPHGIFEDAVHRKELIPIRTEPAGLEMPFTAVFTKQTSSRLVEDIVDLCEQSSTFS
ncbi:LysR family transcriptional regulator [Pigmentiphaga litoralis]|uniref:DNA-binding transcriptional LysR family regulator n=1 Tax=Pigmentiphaga litoralis TaxID=516702 RepID=A0A7Y9LM17_9BURK|nr:LysR family transcriptional regulator [Pigmentiphaga litoralis]NYE24606.1 DNA-binding transcriptional LysR family regulator [Pigmentiphaga litoralis]NYE81780.1 DNA-binding transcriptional LysR family regulator [Pigmentiphaga litoralis]